MSTRTFWFWWMMVDRSHAEIPGQCSALAILVLCDPKHGCYFQQVPLALPKDLLYQMNQVFRWVWVICPTSTHRGYSQKYGRILTANLYAPREAPHPLLFGVGLDPLNGGFTLKKARSPSSSRHPCLFASVLPASLSRCPQCSSYARRPHGWVRRTSLAGHRHRSRPLSWTSRGGRSWRNWTWCLPGQGKDSGRRLRSPTCLL